MYLIGLALAFLLAWIVRGEYDRQNRPIEPFDLDITEQNIFEPEAKQEAPVTPKNANIWKNFLIVYRTKDTLH